MPIVERKASELLSVMKVDGLSAKYCTIEFVNELSGDGTVPSTTPKLMEHTLNLDKKLVCAPRYSADLFERIAFDAIAREAMLDRPSPGDMLKRNFAYADDLDAVVNSRRLLIKIYGVSSFMSAFGRLGPAQYVMMPMMVARLLGVRPRHFWLTSLVNRALSAFKLATPLNRESSMERLCRDVDVIVDPRLMNGDDGLVILGRYTDPNDFGGLIIATENVDASKVRGMGKAVIHYGVVNAGDKPYGSVSISIPDCGKAAEKWVNK